MYTPNTATSTSAARSSVVVNATVPALPKAKISATKNTAEAAPATQIGTFTVPIWVAGAASAVFLVALILAFGKAGTVALTTTLLRAALVLVAVFGVYIYLQRSALQHRIDE